jgi:hypothetical protein
LFYYSYRVKSLKSIEINRVRYKEREKRKVNFKKNIYNRDINIIEKYKKLKNILLK